MAVTVRRGLERRLEGTVVLLIRSPEPPDLVGTALRSAVPDIQATGQIIATGEDVIAGEVQGADGVSRPATDDDLDEFEGPSLVSGPVAIPGAHLLMIDYSGTPPALSRATPAILSRHLRQAGVQEAEIGLVPQMTDRRHLILRSFSPIAQASLRGIGPFPPLGIANVRPPARLTEAATMWLRARHAPAMELLALIIATEAPLTWESIGPAVDGILASGDYVTVIASDFATTAAAVVFGDLHQMGVSLGAAGVSWGFTQVADQMRSQRETIRGVAADLGWARVTAKAATPRGAEMLLPDVTAEYEPASWYQVLSREQLDRLGGPPPGAVELPGGRMEFTVGEPEQWVPGHPDREAIYQEARRMLAVPGA